MICSNQISISSQMQTLAIFRFIRQIRYDADNYQIIVMLSEVDEVESKGIVKSRIVWKKRSKRFLPIPVLHLLHSCLCSSILLCCVCFGVHCHYSFSCNHEQVLSTWNDFKSNKATTCGRSMEKTQVVGKKDCSHPKGVSAIWNH